MWNKLYRLSHTHTHTHQKSLCLDGSTWKWICLRKHFNKKIKVSFCTIDLSQGWNFFINYSKKIFLGTARWILVLVACLSIQKDCQIHFVELLSFCFQLCKHTHYNTQFLALSKKDGFNPLPWFAYLCFGPLKFSHKKASEKREEKKRKEGKKG